MSPVPPAVDALLSSRKENPQYLALAATETPSDVAEFLLETQAVDLPGDWNPVLDAVLRHCWASQPSSVATVGALATRFESQATAEVLARLILALASGGEVTGAGELLQRTIDRFPFDPPVIEAALDLARRSGDREREHGLLTRLAALSGSVGAVHRAYRRRIKLGETQPVDVRVALVSSFTIDGLAACVDLEARRVGLTPGLNVAPFNSVALQVLDPGSTLYATKPEIVFISAALDDLAPELAGGALGGELEAIADRVLAEVTGYCRAVTRHCPARVVVHSLFSVFIGDSPIEWAKEGRGRWLRSLNDRLASALSDDARIHVLDVEHVAAQCVGGGAENTKMRYMAGMRLGDGLTRALGRAYARYLVPLKGLTKKCLVLDLDNTLWGGIVGEDGPTGVRLGNTAPGVEYHDFQLAIQSLSRRGVLLAVNSKNNPDDALEVIRNHPWMVLREAAFSAVRINWTSKVENLRSIAAELNIGLDSVVFVDDNPVECEPVRQLLPQVVTIQLPRDPSRYRETLESQPWFDALALTDEDAQRTAQYRANRERDVARDSAGSVADYLRSLGIRVGIAPVRPATTPRVVQLLARTNQFNLTTQRHSLAEIERQLADGRWRLLTLRAQDRFGDHGLVAVVIVEADGDAWRIDSLLLSCRVIGQGIETALLSHVHDLATASGARELVGSYRPTAKNLQVVGFFPKHGFRETRRTDDGEVEFRLALPGTITFPEWIEKTLE